MFKAHEGVRVKFASEENFTVPILGHNYVHIVINIIFFKFSSLSTAHLQSSDYPRNLNQNIDFSASEIVCPW